MELICVESSELQVWAHYDLPGMHTATQAGLGHITLMISSDWSSLWSESRPACDCSSDEIDLPHGGAHALHPDVPASTLWAAVAPLYPFSNAIIAKDVATGKTAKLVSSAEVARLGAFGARQNCRTTRSH